MKAILFNDGKAVELAFENSVFELMNQLQTKQGLHDVSSNLANKSLKLQISKNLAKAKQKDAQELCKALKIAIDLTGDWEEKGAGGGKDELDTVEKMERIQIPADKREEYKTLVKAGQVWRERMGMFLSKNAKKGVGCGIYIKNKGTEDNK
jgi:hypothetical protein